LQQHIGLGKSVRAVNLEIWWPTSKTRQNFTNVAVDQFLEIKEFAKEYSRVERCSFRLGGTQRHPASATHPQDTMRRDCSIPIQILMALLCLAVSTYAWAAQQYSASGLVLRVDRPSRTMIVSCDAIPGYMEAMAMPFSVRNSRELENLAPGTMIDFTLVVDKKSSRADNAKVHRFESFAQEHSQARRLTLLQKIMEPSSAAVQLTPGQRVPDFSLTDQNQRSVSLHDLAGKVVALDFRLHALPASRLLLPLFQQLWTFAETLRRPPGPRLVLLTLTFDPVHDQPENSPRTRKPGKQIPRYGTFSPALPMTSVACAVGSVWNSGRMKRC
jgi:Cu/Ag efflux protein CusF